MTYKSKSFLKVLIVTPFLFSSITNSYAAPKNEIEQHIESNASIYKKLSGQQRINDTNHKQENVLKNLTAVASSSVTKFSQTGDAIAEDGNTDFSNKLAASHQTLPIGTQVKVTNKVNGKTVIVKISKRLSKSGSYKILSLSKKAAKKIGIFNKGIGTVLIERVY